MSAARARPMSASVQRRRDRASRLLVQLSRQPPHDGTEDPAPAAACREVVSRRYGIGQAELDCPLDGGRHRDAEPLDPERRHDPLLDAVPVAFLELVSDLAETRITDAVRAEPDGKARCEWCGCVGVHAESEARKASRLRRDSREISRAPMP